MEFQKLKNIFWKNLDEESQFQAVLEKYRTEQEQKKMEENLHKITYSSTVACTSCHKKNVRMVFQQQRSADEGMSIMYQCQNSDCGQQWRER